MPNGILSREAHSRVTLLNELLLPNSLTVQCLPSLLVTSRGLESLDQTRPCRSIVGLPASERWRYSCTRSSRQSRCQSHNVNRPSTTSRWPYWRFEVRRSNSLE